MRAPVHAESAEATERRSGGEFSIGVEFFGYVALLIGLVAGSNWAFDLELTIKGWSVPADASVALLGVVGGIAFAGIGRWLGSEGYARAVATRAWLPWALWPLVAVGGLAAICLAVGLF